MRPTFHQGIIIQTYIPYQQKTILFDNSLGKIEVIMNKSITYERPILGALIEYMYQPWHHMHQLTTSAYISVPQPWVDILFLHHLLEMSNYFLAFHCDSNATFNLFMLLYRPSLNVHSTYTKKLFMCRFFSSIGIYPSYLSSRDSHFLNLISGSIDIMLNIREDIYCEKKINRWLLECVHTHPYAHTFKTTHFITKNGYI